MGKEEDIRRAVEVLREGGVILYPTDTVWGIGCDATNDEAVRRVREIKGRAVGKGLICLVDTADRVQLYVRHVPEVAWDLMDLANKPLTLVLDGGKNLSSLVLAGDGSLGVRVTHEEVSSEICRRLRKPVVSTSANVSSEPAPCCFDEISESIKALADYIVLAGRKERKGVLPSSVVKLTADGCVTIIRK